MRLSSSLIKSLTEAETVQLATEIKTSILAKVLRKFLQDQIELSYRSEEASDINKDYLPLYLKEVGERRGYRHVLHLIREE